MKLKSKKAKFSAQKISIASLPDIVFMLLFFFMVTAVLRESDLLLAIGLPSATQIKKIENKSIVVNLHVGHTGKMNRKSNLACIQLDDALADVDDVAEFVSLKQENMKDVDKPKMIVSMKVDKETEMGIVTDIKQELRSVNALKINYSCHAANVFQKFD